VQQDRAPLIFLLVRTTRPTHMLKKPPMRFSPPALAGQYEIPPAKGERGREGGGVLD